MLITTIVKSSVTAMLANKTRTSLTILGMVIGISAVIIVFSAGEGIQSLILGQVESYGTNVIISEVRIPTGKKGQTAKDIQSGAALAQGVQVTTMQADDLEDINKLPNVVTSYGSMMGQEQVSYGDEMKKAFIFGTNKSYIDIDISEVEDGRFFTDEEENSLAEVVVLGSDIKETLFGENDPLDKQVRVGKNKFRVIGVLKERGAVVGLNYDEFVYMPLKTLQKKIMGIDYMTYAVYEIKDLSIAEETADEIRYILRENHDIVQPTLDENGNPDLGKDDFRVTTMAETMEILNTVTGAITLLLLAIVAISLVVGGVGIMNIMYVIVSERTAEIGLRMAVGAQKNDILYQFLTESIIITIFGGIFGVLIGVLVSLLIAFVANTAGLGWDFIIPIKAYIVALGFSFVFGVLFGIYPARKAASLNPIEALRKE